MSRMIVSLLVPVVLSGCISMKNETEWLRIGAASEVVSPPTGTLMAGYDLNRRSTGVHDDLYAKVVVVDDGKTPVALVVVDCIGLPYPAVQTIRETAAVALAETDLNIPPERILIQSIHTHCGPDTIGIWGTDETHSGVDSAYMQRLTEIVARQIVNAAQRREEARIVWASTRCEGWVENDSEPGVVDPTVTVLQCLNRQGKSVATLTNFPCHPTVLDNGTTLITADWVGAFYTHMNEVFSGENLYLQGAIGCWIQPTTPQRTFDLAEQCGADLAAKTIAALQKDARPLRGSDIHFAHTVFSMPIENKKFKALGASGIVPRHFEEGNVTTEVAWCAIGEAQFATHPGETAPFLAEKTRTLMKTFGPKIVLGLGLDELGYFCGEGYFDRPDSFYAANYLTSMSPGRSAAAVLMHALEKMVPCLE